jgi:hypothetical protein
VSDAPADLPTRVPRWTFLALAVVAAVALWLLDTHQPAPWPEAATAWFAQVRASTPSTLLVDRLNVPMTPDLPMASALILLALGGLVLAVMLDAGVPTVLALATSAGVMATRSAWSSVTVGADGAPLVGVAFVVLAVSRPRLRWPALATLLATAPWLGLMALPAIVTRQRTLRARLTAVTLVAIAIVAVLGWLSWRAVQSMACGEATLLAHAVAQTLVPGLTARASSWFALRQATAIVLGDVHVFGVALAAYGLVASSGHRPLRRATIAALVLAVGGVASGLLPPALAAAALLSWWAPWAALGALDVVAHVPVHQRRLAMICAVTAAVVIPSLRHATVVAGPWVAGMPRVTAGAAADLRGTIVSDDSVALRRWRLAGGSGIPADGPTIEACLARGRSLSAVGPAIRQVEDLGFTLHERPLLVPMAAVLSDLRADQLVALALSDAALPYLGPAGVDALGRLGMDRAAMRVTTSVAALARTDVGGQVEAGRHGTAIELRTADFAGGRQLVTPVSIEATTGHVAIDTPPHALVSGTAAAIAVFDRTQEIVLRSAARLSPGLPVSLGTMARWSHATLSGSPSCVAGAQPWLELTGVARVSASIAAATPRRPLVAYVASAERPRPQVSGLPLHPVRPEWTLEVFDPSSTTDRASLAARARADDFAAAASRPAVFWTRLEVGPRDRWHEPRVTLVAGTDGDWWVAPPGASGATTRTACRLTSAGERLLLGQYGAVDDESTREIDVWAFRGWHAPERLAGGVVHQWSAQPDASIGFRLAEPVDVVLALDAAAGRGALRLAVNGSVVHDGWSGSGRLPIPARLLRTGENMLTLSVPEVMHAPRDPRGLGVLVRQLRLITAR